MAFYFVFVFVLVNIAFGATHGTMTEEELHWKSVFPYTPMPKVLQQILPIPENQRVNDSKFNAYWHEDELDKELKSNKSSRNKGVNVEPEISIFDSYGFDNYNPAYSYKELKTQDNDPINKVNRTALGGKNSHAVKETIFFFEESLLPGTKVNLPRLLRKSDTATFLPRQIAESIPFSSEKLPEILQKLSLKAESKGVIDLKTTLRNCERSEMKGEMKYCATSLESFIDSSVSILGKHIQLLSHELGKDMKTQLFTVGEEVEKMRENNIICHKMKYPYAVYLCHSIVKTETYKVPLVNEDGIKAKAMAVCHKDTSAWSPDHIAFKLLKVKPGTVPICHFLGRDTLVWIPYRLKFRVGIKSR